jgi:hypothetical protein
MDKLLTTWIFLILLALAACTTTFPAQRVETAAPAGEVDRATGKLVQALLNRDVETISSLVADEGVHFPTKWPGGTDPQQSLSRAIGSRLLSKAVLAGDPSCVGYNPTWGADPARALVVISGLPMDWAAAGLSEAEGDLVGLVLTQSSPSEWHLTSIMKVDPMTHISEIVDLQHCPSE